VCSPAGVREQGKPRLRHSLPERLVAPIAKIDVLAIRQAFHQDRAALQTAFQFVQRVRPRGVNRDTGKKFGKAFRQPQHDVVRHEHRAEIFARRAIGIMNTLVREQDDRVHRRFADEFSEMLGVDGFEVAFERGRRHAELAQHETGQPAMPAFQAQPAAGAGDAVPHHVDMHVDS
jgi:hypothetical protein